MRSQNNIAEELFDKIRSRVTNIKLGNNDGEITTEPKEARFFEFNFKHKEAPIGAVAISLNEEGILQVYFPNSMIEGADSSTADAWYGFLKELRNFSARNMLNFETKNITKERLDKKDYQFLTQRDQDEVMETKMYGSKRKSYLETGKAKIIVQHNNTVDEEKLGSRSRDIKAIYIENSDGERFKFVNNYLPGARAMARHISNGGITKDEHGVHIVEIMDEMTQLKNFVKTVKNQDYVNEDAQEVISAATDRYYGLKDTLKSISSAKGYVDYFENWAPSEIEVDENDIEDLKQKLTREVYDDRLTDSLPSVRKAMNYKANMEAKSDDDAPMRDYFDNTIDPQEPKELEKAAANIASSEAALADIAANNENIVVYDNSNKEEIKNYLAMMKQSDMPTEKKNQNMIVNIIEYLANNMVDDNAARALSNLDLGSTEGRKIGMQIAVKYLKGKVELQSPKAKKDKFGKAKESSFEAYEQSMEMISEGTWALPETEADAMKIADLMKQPLALGDSGEDATNAIYGLLGDDELFDDLGDAGDKDPEADARPIIIGWLMDHVDSYGDKYQEVMQMAIDEINKTGPDQTQMTIPRTFGNKREDVEEADYDLSTLDGKYGNEPVKGKEGILQIDVEDDVNDIAATMEEDPELENFAMAFEKAVYASGDTSPEGIRAALEEVLPDYIAGSRIENLMKVIEGVNEGKMKDLMMHIEEMIADGATNEEIKDMHPMVSDSDIEMIRKQMDESVEETVEELPEADEVAESIAKLKAMAGVGSKFRSNHGIHEGEEGYQLTPRSIVARQLRKLQDIEK